MLPAHDERDDIVAAIDAATAAARRFAVMREIVVVGDGSRDDTAAAIRRLDRPDVVLIRHTENRGHGVAIRAGLRAATMPWVLLSDADLAFDLSELEAFIPFTDEADLVIGWRMLRRDPLPRRAAGWAWNQLVQRELGLGVRDVDCAFKLIRLELADTLKLTTTGPAISAELLLRARDAGARVHEVGVHHFPRENDRAGGARPRLTLEAVRELHRLREPS